LGVRSPVSLGGAGDSEAEQAYLTAQKIFEEQVKRFPEVPLYKLELAVAFDNLGTLYSNMGRLSEAEGAYRKALANCDEVADAPFDIARTKTFAAACLNNLASVLDELDRPDEAEHVYLETLAFYD
jgi:tetratricopeptide (TPR) repeat protein